MAVTDILWLLPAFFPVRTSLARSPLAAGKGECIAKKNQGRNWAGLTDPDLRVKRQNRIFLNLATVGQGLGKTPGI